MKSHHALLHKIAASKAVKGDQGLKNYNEMMFYGAKLFMENMPDKQFEDTQTAIGANPKVSDPVQPPRDWQIKAVQQLNPAQIGLLITLARVGFAMFSEDIVKGLLKDMDGDN